MNTVHSSIKSTIKARWPRAFALARSAKDQLVIETRVARQLGPRAIAGSLLSGWRDEWKGVLPLQRPSRIELPDCRASSVDALAGELARAGVPVASGGHTVYLAPAAVRVSALAPLTRAYPPDAGLKLLRNPGAPDEAAYVNGSGHSVLHVGVIHRVPELTLVANLLHAYGVGPRLYDLVEIATATAVWTGYVVQHAGTRRPTLAEATALVRRLESMQEAGLLRVPTPGGFAHPDFQPPDCNGNCVSDDVGGCYYVDFQNFVLQRYASTIQAEARAAADATHFGGESLLRGGRYLYQSVPGLGAPAKRDVRRRAGQVERLMARAGVSIEGRAVFDFGCNVGMMMGQYLRLGAAWCHGWDRPQVVPHATRLLLHTGCTRFSVSGEALDRETAPIEAALPPFLARRLPGCAISYLAVRGHIGWHASLERIPWGVMLYEGHEHETAAEFQSHLAELKGRVPVRLAAFDMSEDGDSARRPVAVILRDSNPR